MFRNPREVTWLYIFRIQSNTPTSTGHIVGTECNVSFGFPSYGRRKYFLSYCLVLFSLTVIAGSHVCCPRRTSSGGDSEAQRLEIYSSPSWSPARSWNYGVSPRSTSRPWWYKQGLSKSRPLLHFIPVPISPSFSGNQIFLMSNFFAHLPLENPDMTSNRQARQLNQRNMTCMTTYSICLKRHWLRALLKLLLMTSTRLDTRLGSRY